MSGNGEMSKIASEYFVPELERETPVTKDYPVFNFQNQQNDHLLN